ncbi:MAG TPA: site-2 protease family protein [Candidatus Gracilibacteria bacterium]|nr:site-2 protease family protein [Candidatus Gracilibacteria bacterium]
MLNLAALPNFFLLGISLVLAVTIHEYAHALTAHLLGDPTPEQNNRLSLNPLVHLDLWGLGALLLIGFGWGKPVPINPHYFRSRWRDLALVALAGPISNIIFSLLWMILLKHLELADHWMVLGQTIISVNLMLAVFNLLPLPPLDGGNVLLAVLPSNCREKVEIFFDKYASMLLLVLLVFNSRLHFLSYIIKPGIDLLYGVLYFIS